MARGEYVVVDIAERSQVQNLADDLVSTMCKGDPGWDKSIDREVHAHMAAALEKFMKREY